MRKTAIVKHEDVPRDIFAIDPAPTMSSLRSIKATSLDNPEELAGIAQEWFSQAVASGAVQPETVNTYLYHFKKWLEWCAAHDVHPGRATEENVIEYRGWLVDKGASSQTIQLKLGAMRRFYHAANRNGLINFNPVIDVKAASHGRAGRERNSKFTKNEVIKLLAKTPGGDSLKGKRNRAMLALMLLDGLLRVSVMRASIQDLKNVEGPIARLLVHGKGRDYQVNLDQTTAKLLIAYLKDRGQIDSDELGEPLIATVNKWGGTGNKRIGTSAISKEMDKLLLCRGGLDDCHKLKVVLSPNTEP